MSWDLYPFENAGERLQSLRSRIHPRRVEDLIPGESYVLHRSSWWLVDESTGSGRLSLEIAAPSDPLHPRTAIFQGSPRDLVICADGESGLQFQEGVLLDVPWPSGALIYVSEARLRGIGDDPEERVYGIFTLRFESDGSSYYVPVDPEYQPGVSSSWVLYPERDLVLDWSPVDVSSLLSHMEETHG